MQQRYRPSDFRTKRMSVIFHLERPGRRPTTARRERLERYLFGRYGLCYRAPGNGFDDGLIIAIIDFCEAKFSSRTQDVKHIGFATRLALDLCLIVRMLCNKFFAGRPKFLESLLDAN